ncbi:MAG: nitroreductase family protein, partial [Clostridia bacterium]|nr:nitroreductase family protein [Clostridia bacterium]
MRIIEKKNNPQNIALAATDLGLGSVLLAAPVRAINQHPELLAELQLPDGFQPVLSVGIGY